MKIGRLTHDWSNCAMTDSNCMWQAPQRLSGQTILQVIIIDLFRQLYFQSIQIIAYAIAGLEDLPGSTFRLSV